MMHFTVVGKEEVIARLEGRRKKLMPYLARVVEKEASDLESYIKNNKLQSSPLHHRSGKLQRSVHHQTTANTSFVIGRVYAGAEYAAIHEYGGQTKPHIIKPKKAKVLAFSKGGNTIFAKSVKHPGSKIPERSFMRSSLAENREKIRLALAKAVGTVIKNG
jgi:phage gpG-like protein